MNRGIHLFEAQVLNSKLSTNLKSEIKSHIKNPKFSPMFDSEKLVNNTNEQIWSLFKNKAISF